MPDSGTCNGDLHSRDDSASTVAEMQQGDTSYFPIDTYAFLQSIRSIINTKSPLKIALGVSCNLLYKKELSIAA
ncbi:MAG: hypothetical protein DWH81_04375 [Planctomycetota bacterium]|nr:MAG: hypothetical protein DWH81_04375 [Planctomycetota bacterium]